MTGWVKFEELNVLLNRSLQRSNDAMLREQSETAFTIAEMTIDLPVFIKLADNPGETGSLYVRFPQEPDGSGENGAQEPDFPLSQIKLTLRPTIRLGSSLE